MVLEQVRKAADVRDVHIDAALTNLGVAYLQSESEFIARWVFPVVLVQKQSDRYYRFAKETFYRNRAKLWAPGTPMPQSDFNIDNSPTYSCQFRAFEYRLRWDIRDNADAVLNLDRAGAEFVTRVLLLNREVEWATKYFTTGVWGTDYVGGTDFPKWSDYANSDPIADLRKARLAIQKTTGFVPNTFVVSREVFEVLADHPLIKEVYKYTQPSVLTADMVARALRVDRMWIAGAVQITSAEGAASETYDWIFGKHALLAYVAPRPSLLLPSAGYIFAWTALSRGYEIGIERLSDRDTWSDKVRGVMCYDMQVVGADLGAFFQNAVA